jgi:hypothetical protein
MPVQQHNPVTVGLIARWQTRYGQGSPRDRHLAFPEGWRVNLGINHTAGARPLGSIGVCHRSVVERPVRVNLGHACTVHCVAPTRICLSIGSRYIWGGAKNWLVPTEAGGVQARAFNRFRSRDPRVVSCDHQPGIDIGIDRGGPVRMSAGEHNCVEVEVDTDGGRAGSGHGVGTAWIVGWSFCRRAAIPGTGSAKVSRSGVGQDAPWRSNGCVRLFTSALLLLPCMGLDCGYVAAGNHRTPRRDRRCLASRLALVGDANPRLLGFTPTWAVYEGLTELDRGLKVSLGGLAAQVGLSRHCAGAHAHRRFNLNDTTKIGRDHMLLPANSPALFWPRVGQNAASSKHP